MPLEARNVRLAFLNAVKLQKALSFSPQQFLELLNILLH